MDSIPDILRRYVTAETAHDPKAMASCFTEEGTVADDGKVHKGQKEIFSWAREIIDALQLTSEIKDCKVAGETAELLVTVTGTFEGSPLDFRHQFVLKDGLIVSMSSSPA
jgi:uncharacterized protein (TIGR02246 family)